MRHQVIYSLYPQVIRILNEQPFDADGNPVEINETIVQAEVARLQAEYDNKEYQRQRAKAYPSIADQLDLIYHEGIDAWKAQIAAVKQEYPKP